MDVWMDSGMAWHTLQQETKLENAKNECTFPIADIVVEGADQVYGIWETNKNYFYFFYLKFRGWFQSSLITSLALRVIFLKYYIYFLMAFRMQFHSNKYIFMGWQLMMKGRKCQSQKATSSFPKQ